ncbi:hypothetical protein [Halobaculum halobium]|uniref:Methyltransferase domain-containing protein n=1 Tax=Halobaculum halobium TaxID=3032281 RepID=A0ABD5TH76_9EURY|nr:hypothetical protein [Halobaculum sp. SYNS20]
MEGDDVTYLEAARTVDERAHSDDATAAFRAALREADHAGDGDTDDGDRGDESDGTDGTGVRVLEAGAGTCGMLRRLLADDVLPAGEWVAVDTDERVLSTAHDRLRADALDAGYAVERGDADGNRVGNGGSYRDSDGDSSGYRDSDAIELRRPGCARSLRVRFAVADARAVAAEGGFDGVVARSFADLLAPEDVLALLRSAAPDGWYHLPLTFDGETRFAPDHPADDAVVDAFHATMRNRGRAATRLADRFTEAGTPPTVDARSDWTVEGNEAGTYRADEATFLRTILDTVVASVRASERVPAATLADWAETREEQLGRGSLRYVARNRDLFGRVP